jgi:hypothetical protein
VVLQPDRMGYYTSMESPDLLPDLTGRGELVRRYAHLLHHFRVEIGARPLVRQTAEFFPDRFDKDLPSVQRLVRRLQTHAGMLDVPIAVNLVSLDQADASTNAAKGCGSGACAPACAAPSPSDGNTFARLEESARGWTLNVFDAELHHPVALTTQLSLALAEIFLSESSSADAPVEAPRGLSRDLACVALGLGLIVLEGSFIYAKACGGPSVTRLTELSVGELSVACSLFIALGRHSSRRALQGLGTTQRALLAEANDWAASNSPLLTQLAHSPGQLATRAPAVREARSWLLRVFERPRAPEADREDLELPSGDLPEEALLELAQKAALAPRAASGKSAPRTRTREQEELAALVDEALRSS